MGGRSAWTQIEALNFLEKIPHEKNNSHGESINNYRSRTVSKPTTPHEIT